MTGRQRAAGDHRRPAASPFGGCTASVDVKRVGPALGEPDHFTGNLDSRLTIEAPARVFHQGPGLRPT